ncbi:hypothetical protein J2W40_000434 [Sphingobium xenophagum]|uniref:Uncharacterized protein n=1 Tax=Sphingobium xenophagum TaxID=121428 RepID=A0ABU1WXC4_SPHXE|nr:hypothetical protein [Sphingobium xenophagum]MDR7153637.1 hypothetical protein [Sphingobium xenophagum]
MRHRTGETDEARGPTSRRTVFAVLWTLILITLLSALAPIGPPLSRPTGSAFNPATSDVVIKARTPASPQMAQAVRTDGDDMPTAVLFGCLVTLVVLVGLCRRIMPFGPERIGLASIPLVRAHPARAPPSAF